MTRSKKTLTIFASLFLLTLGLWKIVDVINAEQSGSSPESGVTSRINTLYNDTVSKGFGSISSGGWGDWGTKWNRIYSSSIWTPSDATATVTDVASGKTFYSGNNRVKQTGGGSTQPTPSPVSPAVGDTSRLNTLYKALKTISYGDEATGSWGNWGAMWNRIYSASIWTPNDATAVSSDVNTGKTFYSGNNRTIQTGTHIVITSIGNYTFTSNTNLGSATTYDNYTIIINNGVTVTMHGVHTFAAITNNGSIVVTPYSGTAGTGSLSILLNTLTNNGTIDASGRGYGGGGGGGGGSYESHSGAGGNSYAGAGAGGGGGANSGYNGYCPNGGAAGVASGGGQNGNAGAGGCGPVGGRVGGNGGNGSLLSNKGTGTANGGGGGGGGGNYGGTGGNANTGTGGNGGYLGTAVNGDASTDFTADIGSGGGGGGGSAIGSQYVDGANGVTGEGLNAGLYGGKNGGHVSSYWDAGSGAGGGGSGGGSIKIEATTSITIAGSILSNGGKGGLGGSAGGCIGGNAGGGAGGGIALKTPALTLTGSTVQTKGNKLDGTGSTTNGGTIKLFYSSLIGSLPSSSNAGRIYTSSY